MANVITTPNMMLPTPVPGQDPGPDYGANNNSCFNILDSHNHSAGSGVPITPLGININTPLQFNNNIASTIYGLSFSAPATSGATSFLYTAPQSGGGINDLFFNDGAGNVIPITKAGIVNAVASSIPGESYSGGTFTWKQGAGSSTPANFDIGSIVIRPNTAATTNGITMSPPAAISSAYNLVLPALPASTLFVTLDSSGNLSTATSIAGTQLATGTLTGAQMANATITGTQVASNINLAGKAAQESSKNLVVSNTNATNSLAIIRGTCDSAGNIVSGEGFTVNHSGTGTYIISYSTSFNDAPAMTATGVNTAMTAQLTSIGASSVTLTTRVAGGGITDIAFSFIIIGQRA
jgi:hypothetical protein